MKNSQNGRRHKILIVDDDQDILSLLRISLEDEPYELTFMSSPVEALELLKEEAFSVILSDQYMPEMDGMAFLRGSESLRPLASRILMTGVVSLGVTLEAINTGDIFRFLSKPWTMEELHATIRNAVTRHELLAENSELHREAVTLNLQLQDNFNQSLELCRRLISTFSAMLGKCTKAVEEICWKFCEMGLLDEKEQEVLRVSAALHNIGLVGVPRDVLSTAFRHPQQLSAAQSSLMHHHPIYGQTLASFVGTLSGVGETIRAHHERWDGKGYPDGLHEEAIPRPARFLAVAAAFVESQLEREDALNYIYSESNAAFYPEAVRALMKLSSNSKLPKKVKEVTLADLHSGMVLARGLHSPAGLLLLPEGQRLSVDLLERIRTHGILDHVKGRLLVYMP